jgi:hypothetical protein
MFRFGAKKRNEVDEQPVIVFKTPTASPRRDGGIPDGQTSVQEPRWWEVPRFASLPLWVRDESGEWTW